MAGVFNWIRPGYELVNVKLQWNVQVPHIHATLGKPNHWRSILFSPQETPNSNWKLQVNDNGTQIEIDAYHCNSAGKNVAWLESTLVKLSILNKRGKKVLQQMVPSNSTIFYVTFNLPKGDLLKCQQPNGSLTFYCKIITHVKIEASADPRPAGVAINCPNELSTQLGELFDKMPSSDVNFNIGDRQFPAHKNILAARSEVFEAMFKHPTKENLTNQIKIDDIKPEVFQELLHFIYTGRVSTVAMETMAVGLFIAADKYLLNGLKNECENYLLHDMSPDNCIELLLNSNLLNSISEDLKKEAAKSFRRFPLQVMATSQWQTLEKENPAALVNISKIVFSYK
jgi:speckle-type POZ protein